MSTLNKIFTFFVLISCLVLLYFAAFTKTRVIPVISLIVFSSLFIYIIFNKKSNEEFKAPKYLFKLLMLCFVIFYSLSIALMAFYSYRPMLYFILISLLTLIIFFQIISKGHVNHRIILLETLLLAFNNLISQYLFYPLYNGYRDILFHTYTVSKTVQLGHIFTATQYTNFPITHILASSLTIITKIQPEYSFIIAIMTVFLLSPIFVFYIGTKLTNNKQFGLIAALLLVSSQPFILWGTQLAPTSFCYGFMAMLIYSLFKDRSKIGWTIILIIIAITMVLSHNLGVVVTLLALTLFVLAEMIFNRHSETSERKKSSSFTFLLLFFIMSFSYWVYVTFTFFKNIINSIKPVIFADLPSISNIGASVLPHLIQYVSIAILIFLFLIYVFEVIDKKKIKATLTSKWMIPILCSSIFFLYVLNLFLNIPVASSLLIDRWALFGVFFLVLIISKPIFFLMKKGKTGLILVSFLIFTFALISSANVAYDSLPLEKNKVGTPSSVFNQQELQMGLFAKQNVNSNITTDFVYSSYLLYPLGMGNVDFTYSSLSKKHNFILVRENELKNRGLRFAGGSIKFTEILIKNEEANKKLINFNSIYDNGNSVIYEK
ncbi:hypothetical protein DSECCO2_376440 [anaerobic digester metagenome]